MENLGAAAGPSNRARDWKSSEHSILSADAPSSLQRVFTYSIGLTPCLAEAETTPPTSGSLMSVGVDLCANLVMVAAAAVGVVMAPWSNVPWP